MCWYVQTRSAVFPAGSTSTAKKKGEEEIDYPTEEEVRRLLGEGTDEEEEDQYGESYEEVYNELDE